ncbi:MAG: metal-dependent transcriptional regulator [Anaerolineae bacterium]|jgi:DtxR family Mn-dependent transcriptional regulator
MELSSQIEDYLKSIYLLQDRYPRVPTTVLAERLEISAPSVTSMVRKLDRLGLLEHEPYRGVRLTADGEEQALRIVRAHRLWEAYLVEALDLAWDVAHIEAEKLEHALSASLADRLDAALDFPTIDPHGHPIPSRNGQMPDRAGVPLSSLSAGAEGVVLQICDDTPELLRYLGDLGIYPGECLLVLSVAPFEGPLHLRVGNETLAVGRRVAEHVVVELAAGCGAEEEEIHKQ